MLEGIFSSVYTDTTSLPAFLAAAGVSLVMGLLIALCYRKHAGTSASMGLTLFALPFLVNIVILLVNGNLGAGIAVAGAFSLIRFRSAPGTARDITTIFLAMTTGLACGMGYLAVGVFVTIVVCVILLVHGLREKGVADSKELKITIPEDLDYTDIFDDLFEQFTTEARLMQVKTSNLGSLYKLVYQIRLKQEKEEKQFLNQLRCRNGNLEIVCGRIPTGKEGL